MDGKHQFKVGDRVMYKAVECGNGDLDGLTGTVIYVDGTRCPYTVEFDNWTDPHNGITDHRAKNRKQYGGWFCRPENLIKLEE